MYDETCYVCGERCYYFTSTRHACPECERDVCPHCEDDLMHHHKGLEVRIYKCGTFSVSSAVYQSHDCEVLCNEYTRLTEKDKGHDHG